MKKFFKRNFKKFIIDILFLLDKNNIMRNLKEIILKSSNSDYHKKGKSPFYIKIKSEEGEDLNLIYKARNLKIEKILNDIQKENKIPYRDIFIPHTEDEVDYGYELVLEGDTLNKILSKTNSRRLNSENTSSNNLKINNTSEDEVSFDEVSSSQNLEINNTSEDEDNLDEVSSSHNLEINT